MSASNLKTELLLAGDNADTAPLEKYLESENYRLHKADTPVKALKFLSAEKIDLVLFLDTIGGRDSLLFLMELREHDDTPVILLSGNESLSIALGAYQAGADDFIRLPQPPWLVELKVRSLLKRAGKKTVAGSVPLALQTGNSLIMMDPGDHTFFCNGEEVELTSQEWAILDFMVHRENQVITRQQLLKNCFPRQENPGRVIDNHIKNIRSKLKDPGCIETVRGIGYYFNGEVMENEKQTEDFLLRDRQ